jgi:hypothetical protein
MDRTKQPYETRAARRRQPAHSRVARLVVRLSALLVAAMPSAGLAQTADTNTMIRAQLEQIPTGEEGIAKIMKPMTERLELSDAQVAEIRPIVSDLVGSFESARSKFESGEYTVMKMMMEMNAQGERAATLVEPHLSATQLTAYQAMRDEQKMRMAEERRKAMQEMLRARQASAAAAESAQ